MHVTRALAWGLGMSMIQVWDRDCIKLLLCSLQDYSMRLVGLTESLPWGVGNSLTLALTNGPPSQIWPARDLDWVHVHVKVRKLNSQLPTTLSLPSSLFLSFSFLLLPLAHILRYDLCSGWIWWFKPEHSRVLQHEHQNLVIHSTYAHLQKVSWDWGAGRSSLCYWWLWCYCKA